MDFGRCVSFESYNVSAESTRRPREMSEVMSLPCEVHGTLAAKQATLKCLNSERSPERCPVGLINGGGLLFTRAHTPRESPFRLNVSVGTGSDLTHTHTHTHTESCLLSVSFVPKTGQGSRQLSDPFSLMHFNGVFVCLCLS